jgi:hypothetical protein
MYSVYRIICTILGSLQGVCPQNSQSQSPSSPKPARISVKNLNYLIPISYVAVGCFNTFGFKKGNNMRFARVICHLLGIVKKEWFL